MVRKCRKIQENSGNSTILSEKTRDGIRYSLNQEKYLRVFLENGNIPIDNSATERAIRPFTVGRANWHIIDTVHGAEASAVIYSLVETAKANNLKIYEYLKHLLTQIPKHMDDTSLDFLDDLLPWAETLPDDCRKKI
ncbi:MAG: IS66 family transposase [Ruminococcaceae bacterium]|nr:IS66 family transposase [Oscillospiraceae bacterium]